MKTIDFEKELKEINPGLAIIPNPNREGLSNIKLNGKDVCPVPADEIKEDPDPEYRYRFPNGMMARHNSRKEALAKVDAILKFVSTDEGKEIFYAND